MSGNGKKATRACLIVNARSEDNSFDLDEALPVLLSQGWKVDLREKHEKGDAAKIARSAADDGFDPIVNCGGDGTLNEIVGALVGTGVSVGTIPGGTENVWSRQVGIDGRSRVAAMQLVTGRRARVDVGSVRVDGERKHHFLMMAGIGADGAVMGRVSRSVKNRLGALAVGLGALEALPALKTVRASIEMDGALWEGRISEMIVGNIRDYGGFTRITDDAFVDDGLLDVCIFTADGVGPAAKQLVSLLVRKHPDGATSEMYRAASITVRSEFALPLQVDGSDIDVHGTQGDVEYAFSVEPATLTVILPATYDGEIFRHGLDAPSRSVKAKKRKKKSRERDG